MKTKHSTLRDFRNEILMGIVLIEDTIDWLQSGMFSIIIRLEVVVQP